MNLNTVRSGGYAGIAFIVVVFISAFLPGVPPDNTHPAAEIAAYNDAHRTMFLFAAWLTCVAVVLFTWYAVGMYRWLAMAPGDEGLPMFALVSAVIANAIALAGGAVTGALVFHPSSVIGTQASLVMTDLASMFGTILWVPIAAFTWGVARSGARHGSLPTWLVVLGYVAAFSELIASLSIMFNSGPLVLGGVVGLGVLGVFAFWMLLSGYVMIRAGANAAST
jgi:hypothetical protein